MVTLNLFENSINNQTLRALLAFSVILIADVIYLRLSEGSFERLKNHPFAYFNVWITLAIVFAVSTLTTKNETTDDDAVKNYAYYGLLIGLLVYVPLYNWIISCGGITKFTQLLSLANTAFGVLLSSLTCLIVFKVSQKTGLL
jgi:hypothetical protein